MREKKINPHDLERILRSVHLLSPEQREHVLGVLSDGNDYTGFSKRKVQERLKALKHEVPAKINRFLSGKVEKELLKHFEDTEPDK